MIDRWFIDDMETYIRKHLFDAIQINTQLPKAELLVAAKLSKGKTDVPFYAKAQMIIQKII